MRVMKRGALLLLMMSPLLAWLFLKPMRMAMPEWVSGVNCPTDWVCVEDLDRLDDARQLYEAALTFVSSSVWEMNEQPRVVFCSSQECFRSFGADKSAGVTIGTLGIVIGPRGWEEHYLRHEMIHYVQFEQLGIWSQWRTPEWFKEGMAYSLSDDPREQLSSQFQEYRERFDQWYTTVSRETLWEAARDL